jgi:predicted enzyme related to lactoylglutathione lyase
VFLKKNYYFRVELLIKGVFMTDINKPRVTGIGGIFFKCNDPEKIRGWYEKNLGIKMPDEYGGMFEWRKSDQPDKKCYTVWGPFAEDTKYFEPSTKDFMFNYRVNNLKALLDELKKAGVTVIDKIEEYEYGKFGWIVDPEGNKIELWEPADNEFTKMYPEGKTIY